MGELDGWLACAGLSTHIKNSDVMKANLNCWFIGMDLGDDFCVGQSRFFGSSCQAAHHTEKTPRKQLKKTRFGKVCIENVLYLEFVRIIRVIVEILGGSAVSVCHFMLG
ncbi:MAG: hypothetical protein Q8Q55_02505 [Undibacterium sp.]|nr:hypothetical protein [Undibacterium sp.]